MNTDYQTVATGTVTPLNSVFVENVSDAEHAACREKREKCLKKIGSSIVAVDITTEFPGYQSLGEGAWRHEVVERIYHAVAARMDRCLRHITQSSILFRISRSGLTWRGSGDMTMRLENRYTRSAGTLEKPM